jgi:H+/Na+-translocating ferredoxin:NAD+ oxidoreductase subunit G
MKGIGMKLLHYAAVLAIICIICALGVAGVYKMTKPRINAAEAKATALARTAAVPSEGDITFAEITPEKTPIENIVVCAKSAAGTIIGYAAQGEAQGYSSKVKVMVGVDANAEKVLNLQIVSQQETPGLGTRIAEVESKKTLVALIKGQEIKEDPDKTPKFLRQFRALTIEEVKLKGDGNGKVDGLTGATISSRAVASAVQAAMKKITAARAVEAPAECGPDKNPDGTQKKSSCRSDTAGCSPQ